MALKSKFHLVTLIIIILGCTGNNKEKNSNTLINQNQDNRIKFDKLEKLFAIGDFDGNEKQDTLFQHNFSKKTGTEIEKSPDPFQNEWETVENWFYNQKADLYLTVNKKNQDTLHLGTAQGLYCLINIGDNNNDGNDEIALVIDKLDISRVNSCKIYSLCNEKWVLLKQFGIHEDAFNFITDQKPLFNDIKGYLEKQNSKWFYSDYSQDSFEKEDEVGKMKLLLLEKCN